ncbi:hypothetical protein Gohar_005966 [Gossypium harknessii]|uniref:C2H2-type domain-containing protein n=1 Tax=Gossypium harknessii TaxID=34285 RepID=A0A7J9HC71_9ROSI|nr:hypothetical protein [Gossypium harknessii]
MLANTSCSSIPSSKPIPCFENGDNNNNKRKRRPAGTPDPDAEVVSLSPKTLLESDRYVCEICNQGFQRDQNLQMHRRRHKVPWKLLKRETPAVKKRVFVCPDPSCLHHQPCHALGDLVGIKKHFRRKHSNHKQWVCEKCSKGYAVQSDYKAHLKTCGTRGHSCDCGRVFSRVESFIEHQDACRMGQSQKVQQPPSLSPTASTPSTPSSDTMFFSPTKDNPTTTNGGDHHNLELQLLTTSSNPTEPFVPHKENHNNTHYSTQLHLSIGSSDEKMESTVTTDTSKVSALEQLKMAMAELAYAEEARKQAKRQVELAEQEFDRAKRIRQQARAEFEKAQALKDRANKQIETTIVQITCHACKQQVQDRTPVEENSIVVSYVSSAI